MDEENHLATEKTNEFMEKDKIIDNGNIISWLIEHVEESKENSMALDKIYNSMNTCMAKSSVSKAVKKLFKHVTVKRERNKDNWCERSVVYHGMFWRQILPTSELCHFTESGNLVIPDDALVLKDIGKLRQDFFVINENKDKLTIGHLLKYSINLNKVLVEITFEETLSWSFSVCGKANIMPNMIGMEDSFLLIKSNVLGILDGISKMRLCNGVAYDSNSCTINDNTMMEKFTCLDDQKPPKNVYRSIQCCRLLSFRSTESVSLCIICKDMLKLSKNTIQSKKVPCQDITNTCPSTSKVISVVHDVRDSVIPRRENLNVKSTEVVIKKMSNQSDLSPKNENTENSTKDINHNKQIESTCVSLSSTDNSDLTQIFEEVIKISPPKIVEFLVSQQKALSHKPKGRRWSKNIIRICLTLWCRSQRCYKELRDSGFLLLPSQRTLQIYKNKINQKPGINKELIHWMKNEALSRNLPPDGYEGGLILDEMSIQSDLEFCSRDGNVYLWGFKEVADESEFIDSILSGKKENNLATHVLQFIFLGFTGFRFPLFHFPTEQASASELYLLFWKIVNIISTFGFKIQYVSLDGAQTNRDFAKLLLGTFKSDLIKTMTVKNIFSLKQEPIFVIMDYSHLIKKNQE